MLKSKSLIVHYQICIKYETNKKTLRNESIYTQAFKLYVGFLCESQ